MSPLELVDDRFEKLAQELRAGRPVASEPLRERVLALAPPPPPRFQPSLRRLAPVAGFAALSAAFGVAAVLGIVHGSSAPSSAPTAKRAGSAPERTVTQHAAANQRAPKATVFGRLDKALEPNAQRLQQYDASLRVRVASQEELSARTQDALRFTRRLGGYVVKAKYSAPGKTGTSSLALRIPIERVQAAIAHFSGYGTLLRQRIVLKDLQQRVDALTARIARLRARIAAGEPRPQLERDRALLTALTGRRTATVQRAQLASVALTMVVAAKPKPQPAAPPGRFRRTLDDAGSVLVRELEILLYALLVAGPLLLLGGAGVLAGRSLRRRSDRRLLERTG